MPLRDPRGYLWDVVANCQTIMQFCHGKTLNDYNQDHMLRLATERCLGIIGEALAQARQHFPESLEGISNVNRIVGFRNRLIHAYNQLDNSTVWSIVETYIPKLKHEAQSRLNALENNVDEAE
jgi:uncharacterized protein with HEPN domain